MLSKPVGPDFENIFIQRTMCEIRKQNVINNAIIKKSVNAATLILAGENVYFCCQMYILGKILSFIV